MKKIKIFRMEKGFRITIQSKRNHLINIIKWCANNFIKANKNQAKIKLRKERNIFKRLKTRSTFLVLILNKEDFLKFNKKWIN